MSLKYVVFLGSTREGRLGERVATFVMNKLKERGHSATLVDPMETKFELLRKPLHFYKPTDDPDKQPPEFLKTLNATVKEADGIIVVSAEYNHSIPPALSNAVDHFPCSSFAWKPSGIVTYSPARYGGVRAAMQLRALLGELGCISVSNIMSIPNVMNVLDGDGNYTNDEFDINRASKKIFDQLDWWADSAKKQKEAVGTPQ